MWRSRRPGDAREQRVPIKLGVQPSECATFWMRVGREANSLRKRARKGDKRMCRLVDERS